MLLSFSTCRTPIFPYRFACIEIRQVAKFFLLRTDKKKSSFTIRNINERSWEIRCGQQGPCPIN